MRIITRLYRPEGKVWLAENDRCIIGIISLEADGHLDLLFTDAEYQRRGVATALYRTVGKIGNGKPPDEH